MKTLTSIILAMALILNGHEALAAAKSCSDVFTKAALPLKTPPLIASKSGHFDASLRKSLDSIFKFHRINSKKDIAWPGPSVPSFLVEIRSSSEENFTAKNLNTLKTKLGNDALYEIIGAFLDIGVEQGRRSLTHSQRFFDVIERTKNLKQHIQRGEFEISVRETTALQELFAGFTEADSAVVGTLLPFRRVAVGKVDWPADGKPVTVDQIVSLMSDVIRQAYTIQSRTELLNYSSLLRAHITTALEVAAARGKRDMIEHDSRFNSVRAELENLHRALEIRDTANNPITMIDKNLEWLSALQADRH